MSAISGTLAASGQSGTLQAGNGDFYYRLNWTKTTGSLTWSLGRTDKGYGRLQLSGTWTGSVALESSIDKGTTWVATGTAYTANDTEIIEI